MARLRTWVDWPVWIAMGVPLLVGGLIGALSSADIWSASIVIAVGWLALGITVSLGVSFRVADYSGQPWAFLSFVGSIGSWLAGLWLLFALAPPFK